MIYILYHKHVNCLFLVDVNRWLLNIFSTAKTERWPLAIMYHYHDNPNDYSYSAKTPTTKRWWRGPCRRTASNQALLWLEILFFRYFVVVFWHICLVNKHFHVLIQSGLEFSPLLVNLFQFGSCLKSSIFELRFVLSGNRCIFLYFEKYLKFRNIMFLL